MPTRSKILTASATVSCSAATNHVSTGIVMPRSARPARTSPSLRIAAAIRALAPPGAPPHAPQSSEDACGLLVVTLPWPHSTITGANSAIPIVVTIASANSVRSSRDSPVDGPTLSSAWADSSTTGAVSGAVPNGFHHRRPAGAVVSRLERGGASVRTAATGPAIQPADSASANGEAMPPFAAWNASCNPAAAEQPAR
jgi:hypothetical protein